MFIFRMLAAACKWLFQVVAFPVTKLRGLKTMSPTVRWTLHIVLVLTVLVALGAINYFLDLEKVLRAPFPWARRVWLPLVFLNVYLLGWLGWWWWKLLNLRSGPGEFPDIDDAWNEATTALEQAGIDLATTPVYLVLGRPAAGLTTFFSASRLPLAVPQSPRRADAPLHVFANHDAVFVTCAGASLLGQQAEVLARQQDDPHTVVGGGPTGSTSAAAWDETANDWNASVEAGENVSSGSLPTVWGDSTSVATADPAADHDDRLWTGAENLDRPVQPARKRHPSPLNDADEVQRLSLRLRRVCQLLVRQRRPYCPINGILTLLPLAALDNEAEATESAVMLQRDLEVVEEVAQVRCPVTAVVCDLEQAVGGVTLLERFPEEQRHRRLGVQFPCLPSADPMARNRMIDQGIRWLAEDLLPPLNYRLMQLEGGANPSAVRGNEALYQLACRVRQTQEQLARVLRQGIWTDTESPWLLSGVYLAATGRDAVREQGFVAGIIPPVLESQNHVRWSPAALANDRRARLAANLGFVALAIFVAGVAWLVWR